MKKSLEQSITSGNIRKSNFTKAMETLGLNKGRKKIMEEAKKKLIQEQKRLEQQVGKSQEKPEDNND